MTAYTIIIEREDEENDNIAAELQASINAKLLRGTYLIRDIREEAERPPLADDAYRFSTTRDFVEAVQALSRRSLQVLEALGLPSNAGLVHSWLRMQNADLPELLDENLAARCKTLERLVDALDELPSVMDSLQSEATNLACQTDRVRDVLDNLRRKSQG